MRRVPEFLPERIHIWNPPSCAVIGGRERPPTGFVDSPTWMEFVLFVAPALISGLLMTEVLENDNDEVHRYFFGYKCSICAEIILVHKNVRNKNSLGDYLRHDCDPSDIRRAVRNARAMGRERGEVIMEGFGGKWWTERLPLEK